MQLHPKQNAEHPANLAMDKRSQYQQPQYQQPQEQQPQRRNAIARQKPKCRGRLWSLLLTMILGLSLWGSAGITQVARGQESTVPTPPERVSDGLLALYTFEEGAGAVVQDVSNVGDPLDLYIFDATAASWQPGALSVESRTLIASAFPADKVIEGAKASNEITIEAWIAPEELNQQGPARIVTLSKNTGNRNFTLGQEKKRGVPVYDVRLRTTQTSNNGMPSVYTAPGRVETALTHVLYTRTEDGVATIYVNGSVAAVETRSGNLNVWDDDYRLALGNELSGHRSWLGDYHLVALYGKALSPAEVAQNYAAGADEGSEAPDPTPTPVPGERVTDGLAVLYDFEENEGAVIHDVSGVGTPLDLYANNGTAISWQNGILSVDQPTLIASAFPAGKIMAAAKESNEVTIEAWVQPEDLNQRGPARIVSLSQDKHHRNFTLGQERYARYDVRLRTTQTSENGTPSVRTANGTLTTEPTHVVYTRDASGFATLYLNGIPLAVETVGGSFATWDDDYRLALANELNFSRAWMGDYHLVAVYTKALSPGEVTQNFAAGPKNGESIGGPGTDPEEPPAGSPAITGTVTINLGPTIGDGAINSTARLVSLALSASSSEGSITGYRASSALNSLSGSFSSYQSSVDFTLAETPGEQTVYVQYRDSRGNISSVYSDTIILDTSVGQDFGLSMNDGDQWTNSTDVMLTLPAEAETAEMQVSNDGGFIGVDWEAYSTYKPWTVISYGTELIQPVVYVRFRSVDGTTSPTYQDDIILDLNAPTARITQVSSNNQLRQDIDDTAVGIEVNWNSSDDLSGVRWHDVEVKTGDGEWTSWLEQTTETSGIFEAVPGETYSFRVTSQDNAGNWSEFTTEAQGSIVIPDTILITESIYLPSVSR